MDIPEVKIAVIGGSAVMGVKFPGSLEDVEIQEEGVVYETPFGPSAPFTIARVDGIEFLYVPFHGITHEIRNVEPDSAGERLFYVLMRAAVKKIIGTALCGSTNRLLDPADVVIPDGFVDYTTKRPQSLTRSLKRKGEEMESTMYRLHQPFCPSLSRLLVEGSRDVGFPRVFSRGTVGVAEGPRLESPSEIRLIEIFQTLEGQIPLVECADSPEPCPRLSSCAAADLWIEMGQLLTNYLESKTLEDMCRAQREKERAAQPVNRLRQPLGGGEHPAGGVRAPA